MIKSVASQRGTHDRPQHPRRNSRRHVRSAGTRPMGTRDRPPRATAALPLPARRLSAGVRSRHRRADAALRPAARHRAGHVRERLPVHAPAGGWREARFHAQGPAAGVRDEADRPLAPRAAPARQDCRAGVRATALAPGSRPVVRPRPIGAAGGEPCAAGCRARRPRRCRAGGTHRERAVALRTIGTPEPGDTRRRSGADRRSAGSLRGMGHQRQRGRRPTHRQFTGDGRDGRDAVPGGSRPPAQRGAGGVASFGRRRASPRPRRPSSHRRLARAPHVAHGHQRRRRPANTGRSSDASAGGAARCHRASRRGRTRRRGCSRPRPGRAPSALRRVAGRSSLRTSPARRHPRTVLELAVWTGAARPARSRTTLARNRRRERGCARCRTVPRRARPRAARSCAAPLLRPIGRRARRACCRARPHRSHTAASTAGHSPRPLHHSTHSRRRWLAPPQRSWPTSAPTPRRRLPAAKPPP